VEPKPSPLCCTRLAPGRGESITTRPAFVQKKSQQRGGTERGETTVVKLCSPNMLRSGFLRFLIFTTKVDQTNRSTLVKLILFEKSRVELGQESGNTLETPPRFSHIGFATRSGRGSGNPRMSAGSLRLLDGGYAMRSLEQKVIAFASEREGGFAGVLKSAANAEFAQVRVRTLSSHAYLARRLLTTLFCGWNQPMLHAHVEAVSVLPATMDSLLDARSLLHSDSALDDLEPIIAAEILKSRALAQFFTLFRLGHSLLRIAITPPQPTSIYPHPHLNRPGGRRGNPAPQGPRAENAKMAALGLRVPRARPHGGQGERGSEAKRAGHVRANPRNG
jgi:hypothetical protein